MDRKDFIIAYIWMFGTTKKEAKEVYKTASESYIREIIHGFKKNAKVSLYYD